VLAALFAVDGGGYVGINFMKRAGHAVFHRKLSAISRRLAAVSNSKNKGYSPPQGAPSGIKRL